MDGDLVTGTPPGTRVVIRWRADGPVVALSPAVTHLTSGRRVVAWQQALLSGEGLFSFLEPEPPYETDVLDPDVIPDLVDRIVTELWRVERRINDFVRVGLGKDAAIVHLFGDSPDQAALVRQHKDESYTYGGLVGLVAGVVLGGTTASLLAWTMRKK